jgi:hypothetical protein
LPNSQLLIILSEGGGPDRVFDQLLSISADPSVLLSDEFLSSWSLTSSATVSYSAKSESLLPKDGWGFWGQAARSEPAALMMIDVHLPTSDRRTIILSRYTQPEADLQLLLEQLKLELPDQPPPKITASGQLAT